MADSTRLPSIEYGLCTNRDVAAMCRLLGMTFSQNDPPAVAVGLTASEFERFVQVFSSNVVEAGLTPVARIAGTGELVGALLTEDASSPLPDGLEQLSPKLDPIFDILDQLAEGHPGLSELESGEGLHLFLLGVSPQAGGRGIGQELVRLCLENGSRLGYQVAFTEATNRVSQHIFRKAGFENRAHRPYGTHQFQGRSVFASIAEQGGPVLMERSLKG